jgi:hypothetical protein
VQHDAESLGHLHGECCPGELPTGAYEIEDLGRDLERSMPTALLVEQTLHASLLEGVGDEIEGGSGVAMFAGRPDDRQPIHKVSTQHLVLDLDLVLGKEEGMLA